jgi:hypothetical protein
MAGIIDGEGSLNIEIQSPNSTCRKTDYYAIRLVIINTNKQLMDWLVANFEGKIRIRKKLENRRQCYDWIIHSFKAAEILKACLPYMIVKKPSAEVIIEFMDHKKDGWNITPDVKEHRKFLYDKLKKINKTGADTI